MAKSIVIKANREEKRQLIEQTANKGRIFTVLFVKKDHTLREMTCKKWVARHLTYGVDHVLPNPVAHRPEYFTVSDVGAADAFRNINLDTLKELTSEGKHYIFA